VVKPNFISDDEGLPMGLTAAGNPDIECFENDDKVTSFTGVQQHVREF
jgi:hypothetical protein